MIFDSHTHINVGKCSKIGIEQEISNFEKNIIVDKNEHIIHHERTKEFYEFKKLIETKQLGVLANAANSVEYKVLREIDGAYISFGIHPWQANEFCEGLLHNEENLTNLDMNRQINQRVSRLYEYYESADAIGEIGMDNVWCECDMQCQRELFLQQLDIAEKLKKPIVLHTKGKEQEISQILRKYSIRKLIHWYSCNEFLEDFIEQGCYFTIGPNFAINRTVRTIIQKVSLDRLLVETDGINAVEWALAEKISTKDISAVLKEAINAIAIEKGITYRSAEEKLEENFYRFIGKQL